MGRHGEWWEKVGSERVMGRDGERMERWKGTGVGSKRRLKMGG